MNKGTGTILALIGAILATISIQLYRIGLKITDGVEEVTELLTLDREEVIEIVTEQITVQVDSFKTEAKTYVVKSLTEQMEDLLKK